MQDFEPYFCTFETCETPFNIPNSFGGLLEHMQNHLPIRYHIDDPSGEHKEYIEGEFEDHIKSHSIGSGAAMVVSTEDQGANYPEQRHNIKLESRSDVVSNQVLATLKDTSRRRGAFMFDSCPFCGGYPNVLEKRFPNPDVLEAQNELRRHIQQHMQEIALFLPPYRSDIFDADHDLKGSDVTRRESVEDLASEVPDESLPIVCDRQECDCKLGDGEPTGKSSLETDSGIPEEFWPNLFNDPSVCDGSSTSCSELVNDKCLQSFITLFVAEHFQAPELVDPTAVPYAPMLLTRAVFYDLEAVVSFLIDAGADIEVRDQELRTPLITAVACNHAGIVKMLVAHGANLNARDMLDHTPLFVAARCNRVNILVILAESGADLMPQDKDGWVPLTLAATLGHLDIVNVLLARGVEANQPDGKGHTAMSLASIAQRNSIVDLLLEYGATPEPQNTDSNENEALKNQRSQVEITSGFSSILPIEQAAPMVDDIIEIPTSTKPSDVDLLNDLEPPGQSKDNQSSTVIQFPEGTTDPKKNTPDRVLSIKQHTTPVIDVDIKSPTEEISLDSQITPESIDRPMGPPPPEDDGSDKEVLWSRFKAAGGGAPLTEVQLGKTLLNSDQALFDYRTVYMLMRMFDVDQTGSVDFDEFCGLSKYLSAWLGLFETFTGAKDSPGISYDQFNSAIIRFGYRLSSQIVHLLYGTFVERDEGSMSFDLFVQTFIFLKLSTDVFKEYDEDRDGYITLAFEEMLTGFVSLRELSV